MVFHFIESKVCQCCGSESRRDFATLSWEGFDFRWVICENCSLIYMNPVPDKDSYLNFYQYFFWDHKAGRLKNLDAEQKLDRSVEEVKNRQDNFIAGIHKKRIPKIISMFQQITAIGKDTRILEIGCAWGETLNQLNTQFGASVFGVEPSDYAVEVLREKYPDIEIIGRTAEELYNNNKYDGTMDAVIFSHVLENITDQNATLEMVHRILSTGGLLYIDTCSLFWHDWPLNPYHPFVYTDTTISNILAKHGFEIKSIKFSSPPELGFFSGYADLMTKQDPYITLVAQKNNKGDAKLHPKEYLEPVDKICKQYEVGVKLLTKKNKIRRLKRRLFKKIGL